MLSGGNQEIGDRKVTAQRGGLWGQASWWGRGRLPQIKCFYTENRSVGVSQVLAEGTVFLEEGTVWVKHWRLECKRSLWG